MRGNNSSILQKVIRRGITPALHSAKAWQFARKFVARSIAIVMYHGVVKHPLPVFNWCQLGAAQFEEQIAFLAHEYNVVPLSDMLDRLSKGLSFPKKCVVLTFDDGFRSVYTTAYPILERYQVPATVFVVTSLPGTRQPPWPAQLYTWIASSQISSFSVGGSTWALDTDELRAAAYRQIGARLKAMPAEEKDSVLAALKAALGGCPTVPADSELALMNWEEIEQLSKTAYVSFGSHSHTHQILSRCSLEVQRNELRTSRDILRDRLGSTDTCAYPNGSRADFTNATKTLLAELGYRCGLATIPGLNSKGADLFELHRVSVGADTNFSQFRMSMLGL